MPAFVPKRLVCRGACVAYRAGPVRPAPIGSPASSPSRTASAMDTAFPSQRPFRGRSRRRIVPASAVRAVVMGDVPPSSAVARVQSRPAGFHPLRTVLLHRRCPLLEDDRGQRNDQDRRVAAIRNADNGGADGSNLPSLLPTID